MALVGREVSAAPGADADRRRAASGGRGGGRPARAAAAEARLRRRAAREARLAGAGAPRGAGAAHAVALAAESARAAEPVRVGARARLLARAGALWTAWLGSRAGRALARFGAAGGGVLTGGIAYSALFSVSAALALGYTIFMAVLGDNAALRQDVLTTIDASLPGLVDVGNGRGLIDPDALVVSAGLNLAGVAAVGVLLFSASLSMAALRTAVRAVFGRTTAAQNLLLGKLREVVAVFGVAVTIVVSAVATLAVTSLADWLLALLTLDEAARVVGRVLGVAVAFVMDAVVFVLIVRALANVHPPRRDLLGGALLAAVGIGAVRLVGTSVVAGAAERNPLLASFTVLLTLLVWINLLARIVLLAAAWTADPPRPEDDDAAVAERSPAPVRAPS
ncbi:YihY/virulence factor BrkB family protein [Cellulomonas sp. ATA003]|uniref:YihY/virulence factor BrkB family protein n=1 Tax=Cellulomonas sp. ATA003 TaxID=3073064 RepID=UPI0028739ED7|nr:YihY/virulence factor BrkB family protein [Cellulomonas sp. ATA003]WNB85002.1 YihY/virulence factor BrkB family protein [Cellulomonas sp. ATA003]